MKGPVAILTCGILWVLMCIIPTTGMSIASIIIGAQNLHTNSSCVNGSILSVPSWLVIYGSVTLGFFVLTLLAFLLCILLSISFKSTVKWPVNTTCGIYTMFNIAWLVVGGIILIRDGGQCKNTHYSIWAMGIAAWSMQLYNAVFVVFGGSSSNRLATEEE